MREVLRARAQAGSSGASVTGKGGERVLGLRCHLEMGDDRALKALLSTLRGGLVTIAVFQQ